MLIQYFFIWENLNRMKKPLFQIFLSGWASAEFYTCQKMTISRGRRSHTFWTKSKQKTLKKFAMVFLQTKAKK